MTDTHRIMPVEINGTARIVRCEPRTASETPLTYDELTFHAMADEIDALKDRLAKANKGRTANIY